MQLLGPDHPVVANRLNNLGSVLVEQGELKEAESILKRAVEARLKVGALPGFLHCFVGWKSFAGGL